MADLFRYFPKRHVIDRLDAASLLHTGLTHVQARTLLTFEGETWARRDMAQRVAEWQIWFEAQGVRTGERVALMMENHPDHIAAIYALMLSGIVWVPINTRLKRAGLHYVIDHCRPRLAVVDIGFAATWDEATALVAQPCPRHSAPALPSSLDAEPRLASIEPSDTACLIYTSGTTGPPKGVQFTHRMMRVAGEAALIAADVTAGDRLFLWEPLYHIGGAQMLMAPLLADVDLHVVARFSAGRIWQQISSTRATHLHYLGGILDILAGQPRTPRPPHNLRIAWGAGVTPQAWRRISEHLGVNLRECYGMTECSSFATVNRSGKPGSIGQPLPWLNLELLGPDGREVAIGEHGEIVLSSDLEGVFLPAYLDNPAASAGALRGGKLYTGDLARRDADGDLFFVGRSSDSMRVRGENVSAWEVERVIAAHPGVQAVAAVGVASTIGEQEILLYVQWRDAAADGFGPLVAWAHEHLAHYQVPRYWKAVAQFELTPSERIRKHLLPRDSTSAWDAQTDA